MGLKIPQNPIELRRHDRNGNSQSDRSDNVIEDPESGIDDQKALPLSRTEGTDFVLDVVNVPRTRDGHGVTHIGDKAVRQDRRQSHFGQFLTKGELWSVTLASLVHGGDGPTQ